MLVDSRVVHPEGVRRRNLTVKLGLYYDDVRRLSASPGDPTTMPALENPRYERFAQLIARGAKDQGRAYVEAGFKASLKTDYKGTTVATRAASRLLRNVKVQSRIRELQAAVQKQLHFDQIDVLRELAKIGFANIGDYAVVGKDGLPRIDMSNTTRDQMAALTEITNEVTKEARYNEETGEELPEIRKVRIKLADKRAALVDLARHFGAFNADRSGGGNRGDGEGSAPGMTIRVVGGLPEDDLDDKPEDEVKE